jgi:hypothetical protein
LSTRKEKRIVKISKHANKRALERSISKKNIKTIINNPVETIYDSKRENYKSFGLALNSFTKTQEYLLIVHSKFNTHVTIITVMWMNKGGLKKIGFNKL